MNDELILWRFRIANFINLLGRTATEQWLTGIVILTAFSGLITVFYTIGQYANLYETAYQWVSVGLAFTMLAGFLTHIRPLNFRGSLLFMPLSPQTLTWHNISAGLRFPLMVGLLMIVPYYIGKNSNWFYTSADLTLLIVGALFLLAAGYLTSVAVALGVRSVTRHSFIRLLALVAVLILGFEFLITPGDLLNAVEQTLLEVNRTAVFLLIVGSIGVSGVAVSVIELCEPLPAEHQPIRYWGLLQRTRNLRATYSEVEAALIKSLLGVIRSPQLHIRLLLILLFVVAFRAILVAAVPQYPSLEVALHTLALGFASYVLMFLAGQSTLAAEERWFFVPITPQKVVIGTYLGSLIVYTLFVSLFLTVSPLPDLLMYAIAFAIGTVAFMFGRREASFTTPSLTWLALLLALPMILGLVLGTIIETATTVESILITCLWVGAYLALPLLFGLTRRQQHTQVQ